MNQRFIIFFSSLLLSQNQGVHIHKSFSRVDRVARQLREVQTGDGGETLPDLPKEATPSYSLRSHARSLMYNSSAQRQNDAEAHHYVNGQGKHKGHLFCYNSVDQFWIGNIQQLVYFVSAILFQTQSRQSCDQSQSVCGGLQTNYFDTILDK